MKFLTQDRNLIPDCNPVCFCIAVGNHDIRIGLQILSFQYRSKIQLSICVKYAACILIRQIRVVLLFQHNLVLSLQCPDIRICQRCLRFEFTVLDPVLRKNRSNLSYNVLLTAKAPTRSMMVIAVKTVPVR